MVKAALLILFAGSFLHAAPTPLGTLLSAWTTQRNCNPSHAAFRAQQLEQMNPEAAALYRLSWISTQWKNGARKDSETPKWGWTPSTEIWSDEEVSNIECGPTRSVLYKKINPELISALVEPWVGDIEKLSSPFKQVIRNHWAYQWAVNPKNVIAPEGNSCEERGMRILEDRKEPYGSWVKECAHQGMFTAVVDVKAGDAILEKAPTQAYLAYERASTQFDGPQDIPLELSYRMSVAAFLESKVENGVRAAFRVLNSENKEKLPAANQAALAGMVCEAIAKRNPTAIVTVFQKVFGNPHWPAKFLTLIGNCRPEETYPALSEAIRKTKHGDHSWITLANRALKDATNLNRTADAQKYRAQLGMHARMTRLEKQSGTPTHKGLSIDPLSMGNEVRLPVALLLPRVHWENYLQDDFKKLFNEYAETRWAKK